jgi:hypothetical protein
VFVELHKLHPRWFDASDRPHCSDQPCVELQKSVPVLANDEKAESLGSGALEGWSTLLMGHC